MGGGHVGDFYQARARNADGDLLGQWYSFPLNRGRRQVLELTLGGGMRVVRSERLDAAKQVAEQGKPGAGGLEPNAPNPFNSSTQIPYRLANPGPVRLVIYNALGQQVRTLVDEFQTAGVYQVHWDARNRQGSAVAAGSTSHACPIRVGYRHGGCSTSSSPERGSPSGKDGYQPGRVRARHEKRWEEQEGT